MFLPHTHTHTYSYRLTHAKEKYQVVNMLISFIAITICAVYIYNYTYMYNTVHTYIQVYHIYAYLKRKDYIICFKKKTHDYVDIFIELKHTYCKTNLKNMLVNIQALWNYGQPSKSPVVDLTGQPQGCQSNMDCSHWFL